MNKIIVPKIQLNLEIDYQLLAQEILRTIRKDHSQRELSQKLGYSFNQVGKWESGATQIKMDDFILFSQSLNIEIEKHFRSSYSFFNPEFSVPTLIQTLDITINFNTILDKNFHRTLLKWKNGTTVPDFAEILKLMGRSSPTLLGWLALFLDCESIPILREPHQALLKNIDVILTDPVVGYINAALQLSEYKNLETYNEVFLAEHSACTINQLRSGLELLLKQGMITFENNKYHPCPFDFSFPGMRNPKLRNLTKHTLHLAHERYPSSDYVKKSDKDYGPSMGAVRVTAVSNQAAEKIAEMISNFHNAIGEVVRLDKKNPKEHVQIIILQSIPSNINT